jgi:hypothetical protein
MILLLRYYIRTRKASHGLTETRQKGHWKIMLFQGGEGKIHTLWNRWTCANDKEWSLGIKDALVTIAHGWQDEFGSWSWSFLKFLMHLENRGVHFIYYFYTYKYFLFFFFLSHTYFFNIFSLSFLLPPWTLNCIVPTSSPMLRHCSSSGKEVIEIW